MVDVYSLSLHAGYRCRHSGVCCTSGWPIPVEADRLARIRVAIATGALRIPARAAGQTITGETHGAPPVLRVLDGGCIFYAKSAGGSCVVQRALGHDALPLACRQFPRVSVLDPRGASVTLSHYCPTAASLLTATEPVTVLNHSAVFPPHGEYVGLDAREALPPLLASDVLMDWQAWWALEAAGVDLLANGRGSAAESLARLALATDDVQQWRPGGEPLLDRVREACAAAAAAPVTPIDVTTAQRDLTIERVLSAMPADLRPSRAATERSHVKDEVARRFVAAHAFANWAIHLGDGLRAWRASVETAFILLDAGLDVRTADLWLRHLADPAALAGYSPPMCG